MPIRRRGRPMPQRLDQSGAAAVEFALVSVLLFTILFGILQYGFFFYQLSAAEYALGTAARLVEVGQVDDCDDWKAIATGQAGLGGDTDASWEHAVADRSDESVAIGDLIRVAILWEPVEIGAGLIPFAGGPRATARDVVVDHLGVTDVWTAPGIIGCPAS